MTTHSSGAFVRSKATGAAIGNATCNPLAAWLMNRAMAPEGLWSMLLDTAITSIVASILIGLFTASSVRKARETSQQPSPPVVAPPRWLLRLPHQPWRLGLTLGSGIALGLVALIAAAFAIFSIREVSAPAFLIFKAAYTGALGYSVARWVAIRQLDVLAGAADWSPVAPLSRVGVDGTRADASR